MPISLTMAALVPIRPCRDCGMDCVPVEAYSSCIDTKVEGVC